MKYADLDDKKYDWLKFAIKHHRPIVALGYDKKHHVWLQPCGLFINQGRLGVSSIQGKQYYNPAPLENEIYK